MIKKIGQTRAVAGSSGVIFAMVVGKGYWPPWYASDPYTIIACVRYLQATSCLLHPCAEESTT